MVNQIPCTFKHLQSSHSQSECHCSVLHEIFFLQFGQLILCLAVRLCLALLFSVACKKSKNRGVVGETCILTPKKCIVIVAQDMVNGHSKKQTLHWHLKGTCKVVHIVVHDGGKMHSASETGHKKNTDSTHVWS